MGGTWRCRAETIKPPQASRWWRSTSPRRDARARSDNPGFVGSGIIKMMPNTSAAAKGCATEEKGAPYQTNCMASRARRRATVRPPPPVPCLRERSATQSTLPALPTLCRAGDIRSRLPAAKRGARDATAFTGWRRSGPTATSRYDVGHTHSPNPRFLPKLHSMPPASRMMPVICWPMRLSSTGLPRHQLTRN